MAFKALPPAEVLRQLLRYEPETGKLFWLPRGAGMFPKPESAKGWNARFAGAEAFATDNGEGYMAGRINGKSLKAHRVVWALVHGEWPSGEIDHINGNPSDNRISNLRDVDRTENVRNSKRGKNNTSGVNGVGFDKRRSQWIAHICHKAKRIHIGSFLTKDAALAARKAAEADLGYHPNHGR